MSTVQKNSFKNLGRFCEDDFEDSWEESENSSSTVSDSNRYKDKVLLASGGMKEIYKVFDTKLERTIAMAQLIPGTPEELCEPFLQEATLTASLEHPNIISVFDLGVNENMDPYFTMELKVGDSLDKIIQGEERSLNSLLEIYLKVCDAISYAHSQNIIHLDLKPENIQVGKFGEVQVCDWGLSRKKCTKKTTDTISGTPGYMAPEQATKGNVLNESTDIYALGGILYSILTSKRPIEGGVKTVIKSTNEGKIIPPAERSPDKNIPLSLNAVVEKAMAQSKENRYSSVEELKSEVSMYLTGRSTSAENAGFLKELSLFIKRNKQVCTVAVLALLTIIFGTALFLYKLQSSKSETELAYKNLGETHKQLIDSKKKENEMFSEKEAALNQLIEANKDKEEMFNQLMDQELKQAYDFMTYPLYYNAPQESLKKSYKILDTHYKKDPKNWGVKKLLILNLFVSQRFKEMKKVKTKLLGPLFEIAEKFQSKQRTKFGILSEKDFVDFLQDINSLSDEYKEIKHQTIERSICYMVDVRQPIFTSKDVVRELLISWNPDWDPKQFRYNKDQLTLSISGTNFKKLIALASHSSRQCFLRFLKIDKLDLRGSGMINLSHLEGLNINKLDIRNTQISNLHPHGATKGIKEVYLRRGQFNKEDARHIPLSVKLIYK